VRENVKENAKEMVKENVKEIDENRRVKSTEEMRRVRRRGETSDPNGKGGRMVRNRRRRMVSWIEGEIKAGRANATRMTGRASQ
jgi:hypothetical protein